MYFIASIVFIILCSLFLVLNKFQSIRDKYEKPISFLLSIVATFIGVFIAIEFSNYNEHNLEINKTIGLLEIAGYELGQIKMESDIANNILQADSTIEINSFIYSNQISRPEIFEELLKNELVIRNVSLHTFEALSRADKNIKKIYYWMDDDKNTVNKNNIFQMLSNIIFYIQKIIYTEISYLKGEISLIELEKLDEKYVYDLLNITNAKSVQEFKK